jgi:pimeloyl-ACP methyl ester carboxylesterase
MDPITTRTVRSADGTAIAYERSGDGPALILVLGAFCDRATTRSAAALLARDFTVYAYDRRGRGDSGDAPAYAVDRELEDLDALLAEAGGSAMVFGHSSGAVLALEAAASGRRIDRLVAYEPPYIVDDTRPRPHGLADRVHALVTLGRRDDAIELFLTEAAVTPPEMIAEMKSSPMWPGMRSIAHTLVYDLTLCGDQRMPQDRLARIDCPTLVLVGENSPAWFVATTREVTAAVPGAQLATLPGAGHGAPDDVLVPVLTNFLLA